jgi:hypothetical protein
VSGFLISFTSTITFFCNFLDKRDSKLTLFSPVFPKTNAALAV